MHISFSIFSDLEVQILGDVGLLFACIVDVGSLFSRIIKLWTVEMTRSAMYVSRSMIMINLLHIEGTH